MPNAPSNTFMNWVNVVVTPVGGSAIAIAEVMSVTPKRGNKLEAFYGDNRRFPLTLRPIEYHRGVEIESGNLAVLETLPENARCTVVATLADAKNGTATGGGGFTHTWLNAMLENEDTGGSNNKFASGKAVFKCEGNADDSDPHSVTAL